MEDKSLAAINQNINSNVLLKVYNSRTETVRDVILQPNIAWGGAGAAGITVRFCPYNNANELVWHVLVGIICH